MAEELKINKLSKFVYPSGFVFYGLSKDTEDIFWRVALPSASMSSGRSCTAVSRSGGYRCLNYTEMLKNSTIFMFMYET